MDQLIKAFKREKLTLPEINIIILSSHYNHMLEEWKKQNIFNDKIFSDILVSLLDILFYYEKSEKKAFVFSYLKAWWENAKNISSLYNKEKTFFLKNPLTEKASY